MVIKLILRNALDMIHDTHLLQLGLHPVAVVGIRVWH